MTLHPLAAGVVAAGAPAGVATAQPTYRVDPIVEVESLPFLQGVNEVGQVVGSLAVQGLSQPIVASLGAGLTFLPLPAGMITGVAFDINDPGVIVGAVSDTNFPFDLGEPAIWTPDGAGGYTVQLLQTITIPPTPRGGGDDGGHATEINNAGDIVGFTRIQGSQGGPATRFSLTGAPTDLSALGFAATIEDMSETGEIVGGTLRMDLNTGVVTPIPLPDDLGPGGPSFTSQTTIFAVNNAGDLVVAGWCTCGTNPPQHWLSFLFSDTTGYTRINPNQLPGRFIAGLYDNNNVGDSVASDAGMIFGAEGVRVNSLTPLLAPESAAWSVGFGLLDDQRRMFSLGENTQTGAFAIVVLTPVAGASTVDLNGDGAVNGGDIAQLLNTWGPCPLGSPCPGDLDGDGIVGGGDLSRILNEWG